MTGILLISHFTLAQSVKGTVEQVIGNRPNLAALSINRGEDPEKFKDSLKVAVENMGGRALIIADMLGGTPCNCAMALFATDENVGLIAGLSLPVVIEAVMHSSKTAAEISEMIIQKREKIIVDVKALLRKR
ncbi:MAG TPA: hypothetical protein P5511_03655 [Candidatus Goldiibacteriota bacterium]|nr:hypothetical protein [Candidatus Goldiibacteriota bacterium]